MPLSEDDAREVVSDLLKVRDEERRRLDKIRDYMTGQVCRVYSPKKTTREYQQLVDMSKVNILPLIVSAFAQNLFAEGYRGKRAKSNKAAWEIWQDNQMDMRQSLVYRAALEYGLSYATTLKKQGGGALITPYSPRDLTAVYEDPVNDAWPVYAIACSYGYDRHTRKDVMRIDLLDGYDGEGWKYRFVKAEGDPSLAYDESESGAHGLPVTPVVRWVNVGQDLGEAPASEIYPLFPLQDQVDNTTYALLIKQQFQAFKQRWATGMTIEEDAAGNPVEPFKAGVDRLWQNESPDGKFGEFDEGDLKGLLESRQSTLSIVAVLAQISPNALVLANGTVANLSAEALAALESSQQRKQAGMKTSFGESNEQLLRLGCAAAGIPGWEDTSSQIVWRDTESRSLGQAADAINKLAAISIPPRALWDLLLDWLPNLSQQDLDRWEAYANAEDGLPPMPGSISGQAAGVPAQPPPQMNINANGEAPRANGRRPVSAGAPA